MYQSVIWDFDGTLYDTYPSISGILHETLTGFGVEEDLPVIMGLLHISMSHALEHFAGKYRLSLPDFREAFFRNEEAMDVKNCNPFPGAIETVLYVRRKQGKNFICTNRGNSTFRFLDHHRHTSLFEEVITRESGHGRKPHPGPLQYLLKKHVLEHNRVLMVGDRDLDVRAARMAGIRCCYFNSHGIPSRENPDYVIDSLFDLLPHIQ